MNSKFSERLRQALKDKNISQAELANRANISRSSITDYLKGRYEAKQDKIYEIAKILDVDESWLMGFDVPQYRERGSETLNKKIETIAAHIDDDVTEEEMEEILDYINYIKSKHKK